MESLENEKPVRSIKFGQNEHDFKSPEEGIEFLKEMQDLRKRREIQEDQYLTEFEKLERLLNRDNEMQALDLVQLNFPDLENLVTCE